MLKVPWLRPWVSGLGQPRQEECLLEMRHHETLGQELYGVAKVPPERLFLTQTSVALRIVSAYKTVSTSAVLVPTSVPPIDLLSEERQETFQFRKGLTCTDLQEIVRAKEAIRKDGRRRLVEKWQMRWHGEQTERWTYHLIPELATWLNREHGEVGFYLAQALSGQGCYNAYLKRFEKGR